jgi:hypothetical protein
MVIAPNSGVRGFDLSSIYPTASLAKNPLLKLGVCWKVSLYVFNGSFSVDFQTI